MSEPKDGGHAFPTANTIIERLRPDSGIADKYYPIATDGMSKRELYALGALIGWASRNNGDIFANSKTSDPEHVAKSCFAYADAMLKESEKP